MPRRRERELGDEPDPRELIARYINEPVEDGLGFSMLEDDPESTEHVLAEVDAGSAGPQEDERHRSPFLIHQIAGEVSAGLERYGWQGVNDIDGEKFVELCELIGVAPEADRALTAFEDILFSIEEKNYYSRALAEPPTVLDLEDEAGKIEDIVAFQAKPTIDAYTFLNRIMKDPILDLPGLTADLELLDADLGKAMRFNPTSMEEFDEKHRKISETQESIARIEEQRAELIKIDEVTERRERAFRRMNWLIQQDFMHQAVKDFLVECRAENVNLDFDLFAGYIAGRYENVVQFDAPAAEDQPKPLTEEAIRIKKTDVSGGNDQTVPETQTKLAHVYKPGIVDQLLDAHKASMVDQSGKTDIDRRNDAVMLRRLEQAKALCQSVFQNDIADRIYTGSTIKTSEYNTLEFVRRRLYVYGDTAVLDSFISFLPGSQLRKTKDKELDHVPLSQKFSGRSKKELMQEIDHIITEHPDLNIETITSLVEMKRKSKLTEALEIELSAYALTVLEKLAFKENHSVGNLIIA